MWCVQGKKVQRGVEWRGGDPDAQDEGPCGCAFTPFSSAPSLIGYESSLHFRVRLCGIISKPWEVGQGGEEPHTEPGIQGHGYSFNKTTGILTSLGQAFGWRLQTGALK